MRREAKTPSTPTRTGKRRPRRYRAGLTLPCWAAAIVWGASSGPLAGQETLVWHAIRLDGPVTASPAVASDGTVVIGTESGTIHFLSPKTCFSSDVPGGSLCYDTERTKKFYAGSGVYSFITILEVDGEELALVGTDGNNLYWLALDATVRRVTTVPDSCGVIAGTRVTSNGTVVCGVFFMRADGRTSSFGSGVNFGSSALVLRPEDHESIVRETVVVGVSDGGVYFFDPNGDRVEVPIAQFQTGAPVYSSPAMTKDGGVVVGSENGKVYSLDLEGNKRWEFTTDGARRGSESWVEQTSDGVQFPFERGVISSPAVLADGSIVVGGRDGNVYFLNPDGTRKNRFKTRGQVFSSPHVREDGTVVVGSDDGKVYFFNPDGRLLTSFKTVSAEAPMAGVRSSPTSLIWDGREYSLVGSVNGKLYAFMTYSKNLPPSSDG